MTVGRIVNHAEQRPARFSIFNGEFYYVGADYASVVYAYERRAAEFFRLTLILRGIVRHPFAFRSAEGDEALLRLFYIDCAAFCEIGAKTASHYTEPLRDVGETPALVPVKQVPSIAVRRRTSGERPLVNVQTALRFAAFAVPARPVKSGTFYYSTF